MNIPLLRRLMAESGGFIRLNELRQHSDDVAADLDELVRFGYCLEQHPYRGIAYRGPASRLCPDQIEFDLNTRRIGRRIAIWNRVGSTNDLAASASGSVANEGLVILAEEQTSGRGRRGRSWTAPPGSSLLLSILLFPDAAIDDPGWLTALGAVAVVDVLTDGLGIPARIKWPNDVRVDGRKIAGVLVERGQGVVVGVGLNVNFLKHDLPADLQHRATSLEILTGNKHDRSGLARDLIRRMDELYHEGLTLGPGDLNAAWQDRLEPMGQDVTLSLISRSVRGTLIEADLKRGVCVRRDDGRLEWFTSAEILHPTSALPLEPGRDSC